ncbi:MAG: exodeoxyribonuclease V subunit alpha [Propionicimonas sp.]|uniref:exodeoxyribonuclease V subunit alpha n=1 Tax=Propionicimonas sp. TaxID=1955623 RepID=UPI003D135138
MTDLATSLVPGLLRDVHAAGALTWGDVHVAQKVGHLYHEADQSVLLALALSVRALRSGSICLDLAGTGPGSSDSDEDAASVPSELWPDPLAWRSAIEASPLVTVGAEGGGDRPLRLAGDLLYLERYWQEESTVADQLAARRSRPVAAPDRERLAAAVAELLTDDTDPDQRLAAVVPALTGVTVVAGGPGTGKTHTLARLLGVLLRTATVPPRIALAAPTGKAAVRMREALSQAAAGLPADLAASLTALDATTLHRLLGWVPEARNRFRHHRSNPLPHDVVVVDEASMISVTLMARLLDALRPEARLVLVGDPDQLAPVEAGAVLADIVDAPSTPAADLAGTLSGLGLRSSGPVVRLTHNHRSAVAITDLARAVLAGDEAGALQLATAGAEEVRFAERAEQTDLRERVTASGGRLVAAARDGRVADALAELESHRLLCAHRRGPYGVSLWSRQVEEWLVGAVDDFDPTRAWYPGQPLLVTQNSPDLGLFNGDTGVVVAAGGQLRAHFARGTHHWQTVSPFLLDGVQTIHAMTVHKAQGSQFDRVTVVLPTPDSPLLTRELLYTAITRAKEQVTLIGSPESLRQAVRRQAQRASGLRSRLADGVRPAP